MYSKGLCSSVRPRGTVESFYLCEHNLGRKGLKTKANLQGYSFTVATTHSAVSPHRTFQLLKHRLQTSRAVLPWDHRSSHLPPLQLRTHAGTVTIASPTPPRAAAWGEAPPRYSVAPHGPLPSAHSQELHLINHSILEEEKPSSHVKIRHRPS